MVLNTTLFKNTYEKEDAILINTLSGRYENNRVVTLGSYALYNQTHITELILPNVTSVLQYACANLSTCSYIELNWSLITSMSQYAFRSCSQWISALSCNVPIVGQYAFLGCTGLTELNFPSATTVGQFAFSTCNNVSYANLPNVTSLLQYAFTNCTKLENVNIPKVALISTSTFAGCTNLKMLYLPSGHTIVGYGCLNCRQLSTVIFRANTAGSISGTGPFSGCWRLMSLYLLGSVLKPLQNVNAFTSTPISTYTTYTDGQRGSIYVPSSLYSSYIVAALWSTYSARFVSMTDLEIEDFLSSVVGIDAEFNQGDNIIYSTDTLDSLKQYLTVTAQLISGPLVVPSANYTLSGSLASGICTITVSYSGETTTFDVITRAGTLPSGYTEVKYIESVKQNNYTYINTNYQIDKDKTILYIKSQMIDPYFGLFCAGGGDVSPWKGNNGLGYYAGYGFAPGYGQTDLGYVGSHGFETEYNYPEKYIKNRTSNSIYNIPNTAEYGTPPTTYPDVLICARKGYGTTTTLRDIAYVSDLKVYNAKIIEDGAMVRDFVPCIRDSDGAVGMYDVAGSTCPLTNTPFYCNAGSGEFTYEAL